MTDQIPNERELFAGDSRIERPVKIDADTEPREAIKQYLRNNPGTHLRKIARDLGKPLGNILYHLDYMDRKGDVFFERDGRYKRYFVPGGASRKSRDQISFLKRRLPASIAYELMFAQTLSQREISQRLGISRSTVSFHLHHMVREGFVGCRNEWPENKYYFAEELEEDTIREIFQPLDQ